MKKGPAFGRAFFAKGYCIIHHMTVRLLSHFVDAMNLLGRCSPAKGVDWDNRCESSNLSICAKRPQIR